MKSPASCAQDTGLMALVDRLRCRAQAERCFTEPVADSHQGLSPGLGTALSLKSWNSPILIWSVPQVLKKLQTRAAKKI